VQAFRLKTTAMVTILAATSQDMRCKEDCWLDGVAIDFGGFISTSFSSQS
jgi:hypothetical protein